MYSMTVWSFLWNCFWILHKHMVAKYGLFFVSGKEISHVECLFCSVSWTSYVILFLLMLSGHCSYTRAKALWHWLKPRHTYIPYTHIHLFKRSLRYIFPIHLVGRCLCLNSLQTVWKYAFVLYQHSNHKLKPILYMVSHFPIWAKLRSEYC